MQPSAMARLGTVTRFGAEGALRLDCRGLADAGAQFLQPAARAQFPGEDDGQVLTVALSP